MRKERTYAHLESVDWWKKVEIPFNIKTAANYESIEDAPYHLIMCESVNGIIARKEVHWATLRMGDSSNNQENKGIYTKEIYIIANDRGDEDDKKGLTSQTLMREAFIFIVPKDITFDNDSGTINKHFLLAIKASNKNCSHTKL